MSCLATEDIERYAAGALDLGRRAEVESHLSVCEPCRRRLAEVQSNLRAAEQIARARLDADAPVSALTESVEPASTVSPDARIPGYEIIRELHRGGQGIVYQALQKSTKRKVAVKVLLEGPFASGGSKKRFEREIDLVAQLKHP
ncbi:MAG TPA: zf-HC2 domain-containing protein, partial [Phycisphaerae bacterium]